MDPITWFGSMGLIFAGLAAAGVAFVLLGWLLALAAPRPLATANGAEPTGGLATAASILGGTGWSLFGALLLALAVASVAMPDAASRGIVGEMTIRFWPVWLALAVTFGLSITYRRRLGLYGKLFDSPVGMIGFGIVMFWVFTALFADAIVTHDPLAQLSGMKNALPGTPVENPAEGVFPIYLLGGDHLARDVFSRVVMGARSVLSIAPAATLFAFMVGVTLGLPAGYLGGRFDTILSFLANLVLAFPVILLFYLLVTPEIARTRFNLLDGLVPGDGGAACRGLEGWSISVPQCMTIPEAMAALLFLFPIIFLVILWNSRYFTQPARRNLYVGLTLSIGFWIYLGLAYSYDILAQARDAVGFDRVLTYIGESADRFADWLGAPFHWLAATDGISMPPNLLIVFVSVVFVNSPTVFRIVRSIVLDLKARDYVAAGQTRGEGPWYIMLWEILPNARGPLIVDFCLRIGYTTILLGTLGFFGLGVSPDSPDWGSTIDDGRKLLNLVPHPAVVPAVALMSLVLGLNLLADGLREESLKD